MPDLDELVDEEDLPPIAPAPSPLGVVPPAAYEFTGANALRLTAHNSKTGVVVAVHFRVRTPTGLIVPNRATFTPATDRSASTLEFGIGEGSLMNATVFAESGTPQDGQTYARLQILHGRGAVATVLGTLAQGYVTGRQDRAWPGSPIQASTEGLGYARTLIGTQPAFGAEFAEEVPTGARWELLALRVRLDTDASAPLRRPRLMAVAPTTERIIYSPAPAETAGSTLGLFNWLPNATFLSSLTPTNILGFWPPGFVFPSGYLLTSETNNLAAGDRYGAPVVHVREWLEV